MFTDYSKDDQVLYGEKDIVFDLVTDSEELIAKNRTNKIILDDQVIDKFLPINSQGKRACFNKKK